MESRPQFVQASASFNAVYGDGSLNHVAEAIGGKVKANINSGVFENACAIRMSYVLNNTGIPVVAGGASTVSGADGRRYIYRVKDLAPFIETRLGKPDTDARKPSPKLLQGRKGILLFDVAGWSNASGHATLWDGSKCSDKCYFDQAQRVLFWELK